jgi:hypothetical protein
MKTLWLTLGAALVLLVTPPAWSQKFLPDDPLERDPDDLPVPQPVERKLSEVYDFLWNTFVLKPGEKPPRAANLNTLGEVPESSWFTPRIGRRPMSLEELVRGPNQLQGPDGSRPWTLIAAKTEGITPGFTIEDGRGEVFFIKLDPPENPNLATAAEVISTKFFHAIGYYVAETYIARFRPDEYRIESGVQIQDEFGRQREMTRQDVARLLKRIPRAADGTLRVVASRKLTGRILGPFEYSGTRPDDANDIFPHEDRRELRALRVFSAWLNHDDSRAINTLDSYLGEAGSGHVRHHLIDFASTLGSGSVGPQDPRAGNEYLMERTPALRSALTFGLWDRPWRSVRYPYFPEVGRFEAEFFDPDLWRPEYPNPAFDRLDPLDAFWAARILQKFSEPAIRAMVAAGEISDPRAETYLADTLIRRRDKILAAYFSRVNPLAEFRLVGGADSPQLAFENLAEAAGLGRPESYEVQWFRFDNDHERFEPIGERESREETRLPIPRDGAAFLAARVRTRARSHPDWSKGVEVYLRQHPGLSIVGIEREP